MFGNRIRLFREKTGLSVQEFSVKMNMDASTLSRIENEKVSLSADALLDFAKALGINPMDLFDEKDLEENGLAFYEKYGRVESSYIRFILGQHELLKTQLEKCLRDQENLMQHLKNQDELLKKLSALLGTPKNRGGGVENNSET